MKKYRCVKKLSILLNQIEVPVQENSVLLRLSRQRIDYPTGTLNALFSLRAICRESPNI